jgi:glutaredoxin 3
MTLTESDIVVYSSSYCPFCFRAKALLQSKGVRFTEINVDGDPSARRTMTEKSGRHTVPQIWIREQHVGGCDDLMALDRSGELDKLLEQF